MSGRLELAPQMTAALPVLLRLEEAGYEAVFVGGCVRDLLLGLPLKDVDIASPAEPEEVMSLFPGCIPTGLQHGTVSVRSGGQLYEVTTYRAEAEYVDARRPSSVSFIRDLKEDLQRRDFTINAMALNRHGELEDPFGGHGDLQRSRLRAVGIAKERFAEDALRLLRGVRFASLYKLRPVKGTWRGIMESRDGLRQIAMERVGAELDRIAGGGGLARAAVLLSASDLPAYFKEPLPRWKETKECCLSNTKLRQTMAQRLKAADQLKTADAGWATLFVLLGAEPETAGEWFERLRYSSVRRDRLTTMLRVHDKLAQTGWQAPSKAVWTDAVLEQGPAAAENWLEWVREAEAVGLTADMLSGIGSMEQPTDNTFKNASLNKQSLARLFAEWLEQIPARSLKELAVGGREVQAELGRKPGPWLGPLLGQLLRETAHGELPNEKEMLLKRARQLAEGELTT